MSKATDVMWKLVDTVVRESEYVCIDEYEIDDLATTVTQWSSCGMTSDLREGKVDVPDGVGTAQDLFMYYLMADAVNFCYWYGNEAWRPAGSNSTRMERLLSEVFLKAGESVSSQNRHWHHYPAIIQSFMSILTYERFPLIRERRALLEELTHVDCYKLYEAIFHSNLPNTSLDVCFSRLLMDVPGYSSDMFLKRASLFFFELWKRRGHFPNQLNSSWAEEIKTLPVPIDYHIPNVLRYLECIRYGGRLAKMVDRGDLIPQGSRMEIEIRAASAHACKYLGELTHLGPVEIDDFLFNQRGEAKGLNPIHLTITTDY